MTLATGPGLHFGADMQVELIDVRVSPTNSNPRAGSTPDSRGGPWTSSTRLFRGTTSQQ
ncbi:hypothetical protein GCM10009610_00640 [Pseudonocardia xinjiangensis]